VKDRLMYIFFTRCTCVVAIVYLKVAARNNPGVVKCNPRKCRLQTDVGKLIRSQPSG